MVGVAIDLISQCGPFVRPVNKLNPGPGSANSGSSNLPVLSFHHFPNIIGINIAYGQRNSHSRSLGFQVKDNLSAKAKQQSLKLLSSPLSWKR